MQKAKWRGHIKYELIQKCPFFIKKINNNNTIKYVLSHDQDCEATYKQTDEKINNGYLPQWQIFFIHSNSLRENLSAFEHNLTNLEYLHIISLTKMWRWQDGMWLRETVSESVIFQQHPVYVRNSVCGSLFNTQQWVLIKRMGLLWLIPCVTCNVFNRMNDGDA